MSFASALQRFHQGDISQQELNSEVDRLLSEAPVNLLDLVAEMERVSSALQIAPEIVEQIRTRIAANTGYPISAPADQRTRLTGSNMSWPQQSDSQASQVPGLQHDRTGNRPLQVGDVLGGRFRLEKVLGYGGMSQVFLAEDLQAYGNPHVAVKVLSEAFSAHPDALVSLKRETAKAQQLAHPNIINVRDFGIDGPYIYMWMEYLAGGSLYDELKRRHGRGLRRAEAMSILEGACAALDYAHKQRIVHADLKPGNFMLTPRAKDGTVQAKIIDFGIARPAHALGAGDDDRTIYDPGKLKALTAAYASPEMQAGREPDPRDDIYALGCIAYELFTGKHPFDRIPAEQASARRLVVEPHPSLNKQQLRAIRRALSFERESRTPSATEFLRAFGVQADGGSRLPWRRIGLGALVTTAAVTVVVVIVVTDPFAVDPYAPGNTFRDCPECPLMTVISDGSFRQGSPETGEAAFANERPVRTVHFAHSFAISTTEVTVAEFGRFAEERGHSRPRCLAYGEGGWSFEEGRNWADPGFEQSGRHPVTCVSWDDATAYTAWLSDNTGLVYRLPSASEWEYATAGGSDVDAWWEDANGVSCRSANIADRSALETYPAWHTSGCSDGVLYTAQVATFAGNPFGLHDSLGNVFEWVLDCWNADYVNAPSDGSAWLQGDCSQRELRGGSWFTRPAFVSRTFRNRLQANTRTTSIGFRIVRELKGMK